MSNANAYSLFVPSAVLLASLAGSLHCAGMCGPLMSLVAPKRLNQWLYHLGRLLAYLSLGALAGLMGQSLLSDSISKNLSLFSAALLSFSFLYLAFQTYRGKRHFQFLFPSLQKIYGKLGRHAISLKKNASLYAFAQGLLSAFLPCGWLYTFVLGAVATQSLILGSAFLFLFWLGTLPALFASAGLIRTLWKPMFTRSPLFSALLLVWVGIFTLGIKIYPLFEKNNLTWDKICFH